MDPRELRTLIDDRPGDGVFRVHRRLYSDPEIFDLEMKHIFEGGWVFLGLAAQLPNRHDYFTTYIGRQPVVLMRDGKGGVNCFLNACPHRGARVCLMTRGNQRLHVCPYHSWSFDSAGRNKAIKGKNDGAYTPGFDADSHDLTPIARFGEYRGLLFGSLSADVPPLEDHLGEARKLIDLAVDQSPEGLELVPGVVTFTYAANWKLQLENCSDAYHFTSVHPSYMRILDRRVEVKAGEAMQSVFEKDNPMTDASDAIRGGSYSFPHGHVLNWALIPVSDQLALYDRAAELAEKFGEAKRDWMFNSRNLTLFPNVQLAENASSQLRVIRPIAPDLTEMTTYCMAPVGEAAETRRKRIRQYEDFFNPSGLATPDDIVCYEDCQDGYVVPVGGYLQGHARGMTASKMGGNALSEGIGLDPERSVAGNSRLCDESLFQAYYRAWLERVDRGIARDRAAAEAAA